jgi:hypothetical protein
VLNGLKQSVDEREKDELLRLSGITYSRGLKRAGGTKKLPATATTVYAIQQRLQILARI